LPRAEALGPGEMLLRWPAKGFNRMAMFEGNLILRFKVNNRKEWEMKQHVLCRYRQLVMSLRGRERHIPFVKDAEDISNRDEIAKSGQGLLAGVSGKPATEGSADRGAFQIGEFEIRNTTRVTCSA